MLGKLCHRILLSALIGLWCGTLLAPSSAYGQAALPDQNAKPGAKIGKFIVTGNKTLHADAIIAYSGHKVGDPCTAKVLDEIAINLYKTGYFGAYNPNVENAVRVHAEPNRPDNGLCTVIIKVDENDTIKAISISGSGPIKPEELQKLIHIKPGTVYNFVQFAADAPNLQQLYYRQGYEAIVADAGPDRKNPGVLNVKMQVGRVAEIRIAGNHRVKSQVILREMKTRGGDYYRASTLGADRRRLYDLNLFNEVSMDVRMLGPTRIGITIHVTEK